jgi:hypothetical protein
MKFAIPFLALLSGAGLSVSAQTRTRVTINEATVFLHGAQVSSSATVNLPVGESEFLFSNIAGNINQQSINVGTSAEVAVQSVMFKNDYLGDSSVSPRVRVLQDSIDLLTARRTPIVDEKQVITDQLEVLRANRELANSKNGLSVAELEKLLNLVAQRTETLLRKNRALDSLDGRILDRITLLQAQLGRSSGKVFSQAGPYW